MTAVQVPRDTAAAMEDIHGVDVSWLHHSTRGKARLRLVLHLSASRNASAQGTSTNYTRL